MGLDGGTIATRTDLLRRASWRLANRDGGAQRSTRGGQMCHPRAALAPHPSALTSKQSQAADCFEACSLSGIKFPRRPPQGVIAACGLGRLYLRDSVIEYLSKAGQFSQEAGDVAALEDSFGHIQRLRDVFPVILEANPARDQVSMDTSESGSGGHFVPGPWLCPIDRSVETNGHHPFVALRPCGHVMHQRVAKECARAGSSASDRADTLTDGISTIERARWNCPVCSLPVEVSVRLFPASSDAERVRMTLKSQVKYSIRHLPELF